MGQHFNGSRFSVELSENYEEVNPNNKWLLLSFKNILFKNNEKNKFMEFILDNLSLRIDNTRQSKKSVNTNFLRSLGNFLKNVADLIDEKEKEEIQKIKIKEYFYEKDELCHKEMRRIAG